MAESVGVDVAKHKWCVGAEGKIQHARNEPRGVAQLVRQLVALDPARIVVESTGGYERTLVTQLAEAGLPVVVVNPRRVRSFGQGMGILAETDALDARLLALFGEKVEPPVRPILQGRARLLADLVARRRQLVSMVVAEKSRRETAAAAVRRSIEAMLRMLGQQVRALDRRIDQVGPGVARTLLARPARNRLARRRRTFVCDSGKIRGVRRIRGGRASVRTVLYLAAMNAALQPRAARALPAPAPSPQASQARLRRRRPKAAHHPQRHRPRTNRLASLEALTSITIAC